MRSIAAFNRLDIARLKIGADFCVRLLFFALAPFALVFVAMLFPVTGAVLQVGLGLLVFIAGEAVRKRSMHSRWMNALLSSQLGFEAYYREHPPRPFLYYVFYPLFFPYWLSVPSARREFLVYKGYTLASFGMLVLSLGVQYARAFPPELSLRDFLPIAAGTLLAETAVVLMFLMPAFTTVVHFHRVRASRRLFVLLAVAAVSIGAAAVRLERRRDPIVSYATRERVRLRTAASPSKAFAAQRKALGAAWRALPEEIDDIDKDGKVEELPLQNAHEVLAGFYREDEAQAFDLWYTRQHGKSVLVLYFQAERAHDPIWLAMDRERKASHDTQKLPPGAFKAMRHAAR